jgi:hypothetical protein
MADLWDEQDRYWRDNYSTRPYASGRTYEDLRGGYRYGYDAAQRYQGRRWEDIETDLSRDWNSYEYRGQSTWENIKDAVRDGWARLTGSTSATHTGAGSGRSTY